MSRGGRVAVLGALAAAAWWLATVTEPRRVCQMWLMLGARCAVWTTTGSTVTSDLFAAASVGLAVAAAVTLARGELVKK